MSVIIYSGGLDSTVLLYKLAQEGNLKAAISINYGQKHIKELEFAKYHCDKLGVSMDIVDISNMSSIFGNNALTKEDCEVPKAEYDTSNMKLTVVPNRNMIFISIAAAKAISVGASMVAYAAHKGDHAIYPDCREIFAEKVDAVLKVCHYDELSLYRPFVDKNKGEIVSIGNALGVDFTKTWSCYEGKDVHCGKCGTCLDRRQAFEQSKITDPTIYSLGVC